MPKLTITTKPLSRFSLVASRVSFATAALFMVLFAALHFLEPEFDPTWRFISEYQLGQYGWMMSVAFFALFVSSVSLLLALRSQIKSVGGYIGLFFLGWAAVGFALAAFFITDPLTATVASDQGKIHTVGALFGGNITGAAYFLGWALARNKAWASVRKSLLWVTGVAIVAQLSSFWMQAIMAQSGNKFGPEVFVGWPNRLLIIGLAGWLLAMAWRTMTMYTGRSSAGRSAKLS